MLCMSLGIQNMTQTRRSNIGFVFLNIWNKSINRLGKFEKVNTVVFSERKCSSWLEIGRCQNATFLPFFSNLYVELFTFSQIITAVGVYSSKAFLIWLKGFLFIFSHRDEKSISNTTL